MATQLQLAEAQFVGWRQAKQNPDNIIELISSMGLKKGEWVKIKQNPDNLTCVTESELEQIDEYFGLKNKR
jgi:hypothetical protein